MLQPGLSPESAGGVAVAQGGAGLPGCRDRPGLFTGASVCGLGETRPGDCAVECGDGAGAAAGGALATVSLSTGGAVGPALRGDGGGGVWGAGGGNDGGADLPRFRVTAGVVAGDHPGVAAGGDCGGGRRGDLHDGGGRDPGLRPGGEPAAVLAGERPGLDGPRGDRPVDLRGGFRRGADGVGSADGGTGVAGHVGATGVLHEFAGGGAGACVGGDARVGPGVCGAGPGWVGGERGSPGVARASARNGGGGVACSRAGGVAGGAGTQFARAASGRCLVCGGQAEGE